MSQSPVACTLLLLALGSSCGSSASAIDAEDLYTRAGGAAGARHLPAALDLLEQSLAGGLERPSRALWEPSLDALRRDPASRARLRELLEEHARESVVRVTKDDEPGEPLTLRVTLVDEASGAPLPGSRLQVVHTDVDGHYATDTDEWNPRLFGIAVADERGQVEFHTIRPGYYPEGTGAGEPAHVHYGASHEGYRPFDSEIWFDDDPRATPEALAETGRYGAQLARVQGNAAGWTAEVTIALQAAPGE